MRERKHHNQAVAGARLRQTFSTSASARLSYDLDPRAAFGLHRAGLASPTDAPMADNLGIPYLGFAESGLNGDYTVALGEQTSWRIGAFWGEPDEADEADTSVRSYGTVSELRADLGGHGWIGLHTGALIEQETFLGSRTEGAFATGSGTPTYFAGVSAVLDLDARFSLIGSLHQGLSFPEAGPASLIDEVGRVHSEAYTLGVLGRDLFRARDRFGMMVSQPLRVGGGTATFAFPVARDLSGRVLRDSVDHSLEPTGREIAAQVFYHTPLDPRSTLGAGLLYRHEPGHVADSPAEIGGLLSFALRF